jgi:hypothetical protein
MEYKLGKLKPRIDSRTLKLAQVFRAGIIPPVPETFDVDTGLDMTISHPVFSNDSWGDCVIAGRAHMTKRFEGFEQKQEIPISDEEVLNEYWAEQGYVSGHWKLPCLQPKKPDNGLVMLDSLNAWRKGWQAAGKTYSVHAYSGINWLNHDEVKAAVVYLRGDYAGLALPNSAKNQETWDVTAGDEGLPGSWGNHCVFIKAYDKDTLTCITWGGLQKMTWAFADMYKDEDYAVVDDRNNFTSNSPVDVETLENILHQITG